MRLIMPAGYKAAVAFGLILAVWPPTAQAQRPADTARVGPGTQTEAPAAAFTPDPKKAVRLSLLLPGLGQVYNRSFWKLPLVYGALGATVGLGVFHHLNYREWEGRYQATTTDANPQGDANLRSIRDFYRSNRDLMIVLSALGYALTAVEAYVDAHLKNFNVSPDLSIQPYPMLQPTLAFGGGAAFRSAPITLGVGLRLRLK